MTALDPHLLEQYEKLRKKVLFAQLEREGISQTEKEEFFVRKLKQEIAEYTALGKERGDEKLMESIQKSAQAQIRSGVAPGKVFAQDPEEDPDPMPQLLEPLSPTKPTAQPRLPIKQETPQADWTWEDPTPRGRRAFNAPVTSGGVSTMRGATSQFPLHRGLSQKLLRSRGIPAPKASLNTPLHMEHFNTKMHQDTDKRLLPPEHPGHGTPIPGGRDPFEEQDTQILDVSGARLATPREGKTKGRMPQEETFDDKEEKRQVVRVPAKSPFAEISRLQREHEMERERTQGFTSLERKLRQFEMKEQLKTGANVVDIITAGADVVIPTQYALKPDVAPRTIPPSPQQRKKQKQVQMATTRALRPAVTLQDVVQRLERLQGHSFGIGKTPRTLQDVVQEIRGRGISFKQEQPSLQEVFQILEAQQPARQAQKMIGWQTGYPLITRGGQQPGKIFAGEQQQQALDYRGPIRAIRGYDPADSPETLRLKEMRQIAEGRTSPVDFPAIEQSPQVGAIEAPQTPPQKRIEARKKPVEHTPFQEKPTEPADQTQVGFAHELRQQQKEQEHRRRMDETEQAHKHRMEMEAQRRRYEIDESQYVQHKVGDQSRIGVQAHDYYDTGFAVSADDPVRRGRPRRRPGMKDEPPGKRGTGWEEERGTGYGQGPHDDPEREQPQQPMGGGQGSGRIPGGAGRDPDRPRTTDVFAQMQQRRQRMQAARVAPVQQIPQQVAQMPRRVPAAPQIIHTPQPAIIPVIASGLGGAGPATKEKPGINIKISTKAVVNEKKRRRRRVMGARKEYSKLRRETIKAIRKGRAEHYRIESKKLAQLPVKQRKAARDKLKKQLRDREVKLVGQLPGASKMSIKDVDRVSKIARKLRW